MSEHMDDNLCIKCEERYKDRSESKYSLLCTKCREEQIKYPISKWFILAGVVLIILVGVSFKDFPSTKSDYKLYEQSKTVKDGNVTECLDGLQEVIKNRKEFMDAKVCMLDIAMKSGRYDEASNIYNKYFAGKTLDTKKYSVVFQYSDKLDKLSTSYAKCEKILEEGINLATYEEAYKYEKENLEKLFKDYTCSDSIVNYYLALVEEDLNEKENYLNKSLEQDGNLRDVQIYLSMVKIANNKTSEAKQIAENIIKEDNAIPSAYYCLSVSNMLEDDFESALKNAQKSYDSSKEYAYSINSALMIAAYKNNQTDLLEKIKNETLAKEELGEDLISVLDGKMTVQEYYVSKVEGN